MAEMEWTLRGVQAALAAGSESPASLARQALARSNGNAGRNTYLWQDADWTMAEAARAEAMPRGGWWGVPVSVKDCFDLAGSPTSCGTFFYRDLNRVATADSWIVERLRSAGAVITGKTHLHPLAYGITGENPDYGDCLQPRDATALTGGSSSGAAASVQEGSAVLAIGTDTGGSIRSPAALCGVAGYRASIGLGDWRGGTHLAQSFDTMGFLFRDLEDAPLLADFFSPMIGDAAQGNFTRFAMVEDEFLYDCDPGLVECMHATARTLESLGLRSSRVNTAWWADAYEIFAPIQAFEAAEIHAGHFAQIEPSIRERLEWGASLGPYEIAALRGRHREFRRRVEGMLAENELLLMPAAPLGRLEAGADHSQTRARMLRYTTPFSLSGSPVVTIPCAAGGMQLAAAHGRDVALLEFAAKLGAAMKR
jgi:Asp-tRNA(Asn)/Glu-tRNA(Gln) amidotransferase A subunit family amidase